MNHLQITFLNVDVNFVCIQFLKTNGGCLLKSFSKFKKSKLLLYKAKFIQNLFPVKGHLWWHNKWKIDNRDSLFQRCIYFHAHIEVRGTAKTLHVTIAKNHRNAKMTDMLNIVLLFDYLITFLAFQKRLHCNISSFVFFDNQQG